MRKLIYLATRKGRKARMASHNVKMMLFSFGLLLMVGLSTTAVVIEKGWGEDMLENISSVLQGGSALMLASPLLLAATVKEDLKQKHGYTDKDLVGLEAIASTLNESIQAKGMAMSEADYKKIIEDVGKEYDIQNETIKQLQNDFIEQTKKLNALNESKLSRIEKAISPLQEAVYKNFDGLVDAIKNKKRDFVIKAIDEHDPDLIITTTNIVNQTAGTIPLDTTIGTDPTLHRVRRARRFIREIANVTRVTDLPGVFKWFEEGDEEGAFAIVAENGLKPQVGLSLVLNYVEPQKAAGYMVVTEEVVRYRETAWSFIQRLFREKLERDYADILYNELIVNAVAYPGSALDGTIANPNDIQAIMATLAALEGLNYIPDTLVINPQDKWRLLAEVGTNGQFIFPFIANGTSEFSLLGLNIIESTLVPVGEFYVGESGTWYIQETAPELRTGLVNDDLIHNRMTIVGEVWFLSYIPSSNAGSWIHGDFETIKAQLQV